MQAQGSQTTSTANLARLKIDNIKPKWVTLVWLSFLLLTGILFLLSLAIPEGEYQYRYLASCRSDQEGHNKYECLTFNLQQNKTIYSIQLDDLSQENQFVMIDISPNRVPGQNAYSKFSIDFEFNLTVYALNDDLSLGDILYQNFHHTIGINCNAGSQSCDNRNLLYISQLEYENYLLVITVLNTEVLKSTIPTMESYITTINPKYTQFLLALRYVCLILSIFALILYIRSLRRMRYEKLVFEQKFVRVLGILLIFFNDPIYASTVLKPNIVSAVFSAIFLITFVCALLLFWICAFERVYRENNQLRTKALSWKKRIYIFFLWLFTVVAYCLLSRNYLKDPSYDFNDEHEKAFTAFKVLMIILMTIGLGWILYGFIQIVRRYKIIIWRHKIFFSFSIGFIFIYFIFMFTGMFSVGNTNGTKVILLFGITNVYIWFLMILYSPYGTGMQGSEQPVPSIGEGIRAFQGYEALDDESRHVELGDVIGYNPQSKEHEVQSPDDVIFQLDQNGHVLPQKQNLSVENQGFGSMSNNRVGHGSGQGFEMTNQNFGNSYGRKEENKYPFDANPGSGEIS